MSLPIWYLLIPLVVVTIATGFFLLFNLFDMGVYGVASRKTKAIIGLYVGGFFAVLFFTGLNLATIDWSATIDLSSFLPGTNANMNSFGL